MKTTRPLNMEEKRKLEKIIFADIDKAIATYNEKQSKIYNKASGELVKSARAKVLEKAYIKAQDELQKTEKDLEKAGFKMSGGYRDGDVIELGYDSRSHFKVLYKLNEKQEKTLKELEDMRRIYTIKLFAGGVEAQEVFGALAKDLAKLTA